MKRIACMMIILAVVGGFNPLAATARVLTITPDPVAVLPADDSGAPKIAFRFDVASLDQEGVRIQYAFLEWTLEGVDPDYAPEFTAYPVTAAWNASAVAAGEASVSTAESYTASWAIEALDYERNGGFVRLDVTETVLGWLADAETNHGLLVAATGVNRTAVSTEVGDIRLVVRYGYRSN